MGFFDVHATADASCLKGSEHAESLHYAVLAAFKHPHNPSILSPCSVMSIDNRYLSSEEDLSLAEDPVTFFDDEDDASFADDEDEEAGRSSVEEEDNFEDCLEGEPYTMDMEKTSFTVGPSKVPQQPKLLQADVLSCGQMKDDEQVKNPEWSGPTSPSAVPLLFAVQVPIVSAGKPRVVDVCHKASPPNSTRDSSCYFTSQNEISPVPSSRTSMISTVISSSARSELSSASSNPPSRPVSLDKPIACQDLSNSGFVPGHRATPSSSSDQQHWLQWLRWQEQLQVEVRRHSEACTQEEALRHRESLLRADCHLSQQQIISPSQSRRVSISSTLSSLLGAYTHSSTSSRVFSRNSFSFRPHSRGLSASSIAPSSIISSTSILSSSSPAVDPPSSSCSASVSGPSTFTNSRPSFFFRRSSKNVVLPPTSSAEDPFERLTKVDTYEEEKIAVRPPQTRSLRIAAAARRSSVARVPAKKKGSENRESIPPMPTKMLQFGVSIPVHEEEAVESEVQREENKIEDANSCNENTQYQPKTRTIKPIVTATAEVTNSARLFPETLSRRGRTASVTGLPTTSLNQQPELQKLKPKLVLKVNSSASLRVAFNRLQDTRESPKKTQQNNDVTNSGSLPVRSIQPQPHPLKSSVTVNSVSPAVSPQQQSRRNMIPRPMPRSVTSPGKILVPINKPKQSKDMDVTPWATSNVSSSSLSEVQVQVHVSIEGPKGPTTIGAEKGSLFGRLKWK